MTKKEWRKLKKEAKFLASQQRAYFKARRKQEQKPISIWDRSVSNA